MMKDFKNVIITFGLIATALISGSFLYRKKVESEYAIAAKQEQLQNLIDEQQVILDQLSQQDRTEAVATTQNIPTQTLIPAQSAQSKQSSVVTPKATTTVAKSRSTIQPSPVVVTPTPVPPKPQVVIKPTRRSRAS